MLREALRLLAASLPSEAKIEYRQLDEVFSIAGLPAACSIA